MSTTKEITRMFEGTEVPGAGTYAFDPTHSSVEFVARHLMVSKVRGRLAPPTGTFIIAEDPTQSSVAVTLDPATVSTGDETRDNHLRSADFFDVEHYPTVSFASTGVRHIKGNKWQLNGHLTIKDVTRPVTLDLEVDGALQDPWGNIKVGFSASTEIDREEWGLTWNQVLESGGVLVGKKIKIELTVEAALQV
jgi:polyisoprenoid-binding protein YceI